MLTIFSTPKPFRDHFGIIQTNALQSWLWLHPPCEIILFGDDEGAEEIASRFGVRHIPRIGCNKWGTPLISSLFEEAQKIANNQILCYLNADIILMSDFIQSVQRLKRRKFLLVGQRWNLEVNTLLNFDDPGWESKLRAKVVERGILDKPDGLDYFVFPKGTFSDIPPFSVGRPGWDNWMIYWARYLGIPVIDVTPSVTVVHQIHDYSHHPQGKDGVWKGQEAEANFRLLKKGSDSFTLWDATWILKGKVLRPAFTRKHIRRRMDTLTILFPKRSVQVIKFRLLFSCGLTLYNFYDWLAARRGCKAALTIFRKLFSFTINFLRFR